MNRKNILFVVSAPSGAGKTTIIRKVLKSIKDLDLSISYTTREPRPRETNNIDYRFISEKDFKVKIDEKRMVEWAFVHGNYYGSGRDCVEKSFEKGNDVIFDIDVQGGEQIKKLFPEAVLIFIIPPDAEELKSRLLKRKTESEEQLRLRINKINDEIQKGAEHYQYLIINDNLNYAVNNLLTIIRAERLRFFRQIVDPSFT